MPAKIGDRGNILYTARPPRPFHGHEAYSDNDGKNITSSLEVSNHNKVVNVLIKTNLTDILDVSYNRTWSSTPEHNYDKHIHTKQSRAQA